MGVPPGMFLDRAAPFDYAFDLIYAFPNMLLMITLGWFQSISQFPLAPAGRGNCWLVMWWAMR